MPACRLLERDPPVDWREVLLDLRRWGWRLSDVATAINVPRSTAGRWMYDGYEPNFENGRALLKLHAEERSKILGVDR